MVPMDPTGTHTLHRIHRDLSGAQLSKFDTTQKRDVVTKVGIWTLRSLCAMGTYLVNDHIFSCGTEDFPTLLWQEVNHKNTHFNHDAPRALLSPTSDRRHAS